MQMVRKVSWQQDFPFTPASWILVALLMIWQVSLMMSLMRSMCISSREEHTSLLFVSGTPEGRPRFGWMNSNCSTTQLDQLPGGNPTESEWLIGRVFMCVSVTCKRALGKRFTSYSAHSLPLLSAFTTGRSFVRASYANPSSGIWTTFIQSSSESRRVSLSARASGDWWLQIAVLLF